MQRPTFVQLMFTDDGQIIDEPELPQLPVHPGDRRRWLMQIREADPDGGQFPPTDADHAAHQAWTIHHFGAEAWPVYSTEGWDEPDSY